MSTAYEKWKAQYPLHAIAQLGDIAAFDAQIDDFLPLLQTKDVEQWFWIHYASFEGHTNFIAHVFNKIERDVAKALITAPNHFGSTPLHLAVGTSNVECLKLLLNYVDELGQLEVKNEDKQTPQQMLLIADHSQKEMRLLITAKKEELAAKQ